MDNFWKKIKRPILALAPMAGITDSAFRQICAFYGADVVYSEMVSADGLVYKSKKTLDLLQYSEKEGRAVVQLFGKNPEHFNEAAKIASQYGFSGIDINFGCPAKKVVAHGGGVTLMRDLDKCYEIVKQTCRGSKLPVSVKIRSSIKSGKTKVTALDFVKKIKSLPIKVIMIHGRSYEQGFKGDIKTIDFAMIKKVKKLVGSKIIVLANGAIKTPVDARLSFVCTNADGVGLAQGILGKPWLFKQVREFLATEKFKEFSLNQIKGVALKHAKLNEKLKGERGMFEIRKHLAWYIKGFEHAAQFRGRLVRVENVKQVEKILGEIK